MAQRIEEIYRSEMTLIEGCENLVLVFGLQPTNRDEMATVFRSARSVAMREPSGIGLMLCVLPGVRPPEPHLRDMMTQNLKNLPSMKGMAWVLLGEGFMPAAARSVLAAVTVAIRTEYPMKVFSDFSSGLSWLTGELDGVGGARLDAIALIDHSNNVVRSAAESPPASLRR